MDDVEIREAQLVFVNLECRWVDERNRNPRLMRELDRAEKRLIVLFMDEWRERGGGARMMAKAYAEYRKTLLHHGKRN